MFKIFNIMKKIKNTYKILLALLVFVSCKEEFTDLSFIDNIAPPTNVSAVYNIAQDNTGMVEITPVANGATYFDIYFGDDTTEAEKVIQGEKVEHTYPEGSYPVKIVAYNINGDAVEVTKELVVSFKAPENLEVNAEIDGSNPFLLNVSATADYAASFLVYFDTTNADEVGTPLELGGTISNEYAGVGDYTIKVVALSGGAETSEVEQMVTISSPIVFPINFEIFDASEFIGFGGASASVIDNPKTDGNSSSKVGEIVKGGPEVWAGNVITMSSPIDFSTKKVVKMNVWSPRAGGKLILKIENLDDANINIEKEVVLNGNSSWEEVEFDLSDIDVSQSYQKLVLFFDLGVVGSGGADWTFYIDDINQGFPSTSGAVSTLVQDFEGTAPTFTDFGDMAAIEIVPNPDATGGVNSTSNAAKFVKSSGSKTWAGAFFDIPTGLDVVNNNKMTVKTWSPKSGITVRFKIENANDNNQFVEVDATTTKSNEWEELTFDISSALPSGTYDRIVIFFDWDVAGDDSVYYYDEITLVSDSGTGSSNPVVLYEDFEGTAPTFTYFGDMAAIEVIANPSATGINATSMVAKFVKSNGSKTWAGAFFDRETSLDVANYSKGVVKVWSPKSGITVRFKIENSADNTQFVEVDAVTTKTNEWEELTFDISGALASVTYDRVVIFFDWDVAGDGTTYYFDEMGLTN